MRLLRLALPLAALASVLLLAGCGGSGNSKEDFIAKADDICAAAEKKTKDLGKKSEAAQTQAREQNSLKPFAPVLQEGADLVAQTNDELKALTPPTGDEAKISAITAGIAQGGKLFQQAADAAAANDQQAFQRAGAKLQATQAKEKALARAYGLKKC